MTSIKIGDKVQHSDSNINNGQPMEVIEIGSESAYCEHFDAYNNQSYSWFSLEVLTVIPVEIPNPDKRGFTNEG